MEEEREAFIQEVHALFHGCKTAEYYIYVHESIAETNLLDVKDIRGRQKLFKICVCCGVDRRIKSYKTSRSLCFCELCEKRFDVLMEKVRGWKVALYEEIRTEYVPYLYVRRDL